MDLFRSINFFFCNDPRPYDFPKTGDPRILIQPQGVYQVTIGDKVQIKCTSFGFPTPSVMLRFPPQINKTLKQEMKFIKRNGFIKTEFTAENKFEGNYTCTSRNNLGSRTDWVQIVGEDTSSLVIITKLFHRKSIQSSTN